MADPWSRFAQFYLRQTAWQKKQHLKAKTVNTFERKWETQQHVSQYCQVFILFLTVCIFTLIEETHATLTRGLSIRLFWNVIGEAHADPEWPEWFKKYHKCLFYPYHPRMALPCQISTGKYVNPCLDSLGIPDQRTAYANGKCDPDGRTYVDQMSPPTWLRMLR